MEIIINCLFELPFEKINWTVLESYISCLLLCLLQFMGKWYEVAVVSSCPHYTRRKSADPVIVALDLQHVTSEGNFTMTATSFRSDSDAF